VSIGTPLLTLEASDEHDPSADGNDPCVHGRPCRHSTGERQGSLPAVCGFLGASRDLLKPGATGEAGLRYVNPEARLTQYNEVIGFLGCTATAGSVANLRGALVLEEQVLDSFGLFQFRAIRSAPLE
jgi:hypothetical protein